MTDIIRRKPASFEEYWLASKAWQRNGLTLGARPRLSQCRLPHSRGSAKRSHS